MVITQEQINGLYDAEVVTDDEDNLGGVQGVFLDDATGEPSWVSVRTGWFGTRQSLIPLAEADITGDWIQVPFTREMIREAPQVDSEGHLSEEEQDQLVRYYVGTGRFDAGQVRLRRHETAGTGDEADARTGDETDPGTGDKTDPGAGDGARGPA